MIGGIFKHSKRSGISSIAHELIIEEVRNTPESNTNGNGYGYLIPNQEERSFGAVGKICKSEHYPNDPSMKTHPSLINSKHLEWLGEVVCEIIEHNIPESSPANDAADNAESQKIEVSLAHYSAVFNPKIGSEYAQCISEPIIRWRNR